MTLIEVCINETNISVFSYTITLLIEYFILTNISTRFMVEMTLPHLWWKSQNEENELIYCIFEISRRELSCVIS